MFVKNLWNVSSLSYSKTISGSDILVCWFETDPIIYISFNMVNTSFCPCCSYWAIEYNKYVIPSFTGITRITNISNSS